jgi:hypothetical protein
VVPSSKRNQMLAVFESVDHLGEQLGASCNGEVVLLGNVLGDVVQAGGAIADEADVHDVRVACHRFPRFAEEVLWQKSALADDVQVWVPLVGGSRSGDLEECCAADDAIFPDGPSAKSLEAMHESVDLVAEG